MSKYILWAIPIHTVTQFVSRHVPQVIWYICKNSCRNWYFTHIAMKNVCPQHLFSSPTVVCAFVLLSLLHSTKSHCLQWLRYIVKLFVTDIWHQLEANFGQASIVVVVIFIFNTQISTTNKKMNSVCQGCQRSHMAYRSWPPYQFKHE